MGNAKDPIVKEEVKSADDFIPEADELEDIYEVTPQDIIQSYHHTEKTIKEMMGQNIEYPDIADKYLEIIELEKEATRKTLGEENKDLFKYL